MLSEGFHLAGGGARGSFRNSSSLAHQIKNSFSLKVVLERELTRMTEKRREVTHVVKVLQDIAKNPTVDDINQAGRCPKCRSEDCIPASLIPQKDFKVS